MVDDQDSNSESVYWSTVSDRDRGILTKQDRAYLMGEVELNGQDKRNARYRIRQRLIHSLLDLELLTSTFTDERDLRQVANHDYLSELLETRNLESPILLTNSLLLMCRLVDSNDGAVNLYEALEAAVGNVVERIEEERTNYSKEEKAASIVASVDIEVDTKPVSSREVAEAMETIMKETDASPEDFSGTFDKLFLGDTEELGREVVELLRESEEEQDE